MALLSGFRFDRFAAGRFLRFCDMSLTVRVTRHKTLHRNTTTWLENNQGELLTRFTDSVIPRIRRKKSDPLGVG
jgi:hypothetical protein